MSAAADLPVVAIIGGGFTGASTAFHLARALDSPARIVVIEPRAQLGQGLAYATRDPSHRINVPAARMTMDSAAPGGLQTWVETQRPALSAGTRLATGELFVQRGLVGEYVAAALAPLLAAGRVEHLRARAATLARGARFTLGCDDGRRLVADLVVLATSHPPPGVPAVLAPLAGSARLIADSSDGARLRVLARDARNLLIVGTGLTSADVIASLDRQGFAGRITALSRRGLRPRGHAFGHPDSAADFATDPARTALALLRRVRAAVRRDAGAGLPWQATLDNVRRDGPVIWAALPLAERARLVRRLRVWWDVHRFRIAPQLEAVIERRLAEGRLSIVAGRLLSAQESAAGVELRWHDRRAGAHAGLFDAVILTTGPAHGAILREMPLFAAMAAAGLIRADPLQLGLDVTEGCRAVGRDGAPVPGLFVAGPLARGHVGELMGIPEVTQHAERVAARLAQALAGRAHPVAHSA